MEQIIDSCNEIHKAHISSDDSLIRVESEHFNKIFLESDENPVFVFPPRMIYFSRF